MTRRTCPDAVRLRISWCCVACALSVGRSRSQVAVDGGGDHEVLSSLRLPQGCCGVYVRGILEVVCDGQSGRFAENGDGARVEADDSNNSVSVAQSEKCHREAADGLACREYREGSQKRVRHICRRQPRCCFMKTADNETLS